MLLSNYRMNYIFCKKIRLDESGILRGMTDHHSHLLPGVDDGVKTLSESLELLDGMERQGIRKVWLTPHVMEDIPNATAALKEKFRELKAVYQGGMELDLAAEYMMDNLFEERLANDDLLPLCENERYLLVETSYFNPPMNLASVLKRICEKGYRPLLAHPERYTYMTLNDYSALKDQQIAFQLNLPSLAGLYGVRVQKKAASLLQAGMYDLTGNDLHSLKHFTELSGTRIGRRSRDMLWAHCPACHDAREARHRGTASAASG